MLNGQRLWAGTFGLMLAATALNRPIAAAELYSAPAADDVRTRALEWVAARNIEDKQRLERIGKVWAFGRESPPARILFDKVIETFSLADPATRQLIEACALQDAPLLAPQSDVLSQTNADEFYRANLRLFYGRYLAQRAMYDEGLDVLAELDAKSVVDPATCLFYLAVCQHQLLMKKEGLATIDKLLKNTEDVPLSYSTVATLMQYELQALREKTLGQVARKMQDSERRLDLGRGGQRVQKVQDEIAELLDEIIKKLEQQSGGGGGASGSGRNNSNRSSSPAEDSSVKGATAPGNVDPKKLKNQGGWGSLPPKQEARAKNLINRNFPAHYRRAVEEYFKKLAKRRKKSGRRP